MAMDVGTNSNADSNPEVEAVDASPNQEGTSEK